MKKAIALLLLTAVLGGLVTGCCHTEPSGSREFRPGQGWVPND